MSTPASVRNASPETPVIRPGALIALAASLLAATTTPVRAATPAGVTVSNAWMRMLTPDIPAGGYFELRNGGANPLVLTGASSPDCGMLMLHRSSDTGGMDSMREVGNLDIPAGRTLFFAPGGYHLMCMSPSPSMKPGGSVPVTLRFGGGQTATVPFAVRGARGS